MKILSWNVNGIRTALKADLPKLMEQGYDIMAFQEVKVVEVPKLPKSGYFAIWNTHESRAYSGTLVLTKDIPLHVYLDMELPEGLAFTEDSEAIEEDFDYEARVITCEYIHLYFINVYFPSKLRNDERAEYRKKWDVRFLRYVLLLRMNKPVIIAGDFNVTLDEADFVYDREWNSELRTGFTTADRGTLRLLMEQGFIDSYRHLYADKRASTWVGVKKIKGADVQGRRLDYFFVDSVFEEKIARCEILSDAKGSDHFPIILEMNLVPGGMTTEPYNYAKFEKWIKTKERSLPEHPVYRAERTSVLSAMEFTNLSSFWENVNWEDCEEYVAHLQSVISKVAYRREVDEISHWQMKLVCSIEAKLLAVRHVCSTTAGPGIDGVIWSTPDEKFKAALSLTSKGYKAHIKRLLALRQGKKERRIHIATYYDRAMQALYAMSLDPVAEAWGDRKSFAFRKGRSAADLNEYIRAAFDGEDAPVYGFVADVKQFYESISHDWVMKNIPMAKSVLHEFLNAHYLLSGDLFPMRTGVGLGLSISPIIANMTLDGMQEYIYKRLYPDGDIDYANGNLIRYADDILVATRDSNDAVYVEQIIRDFLRERGLSLSEKKCRVVNVKKGFDFMSRHYVRKKGRVYIYPSDEAVDRFKENITELITQHTMTREQLIKKLNQKISGFATYHKTEDAMDVFRHLDVFLKKFLLDYTCEKLKGWSRDRVIANYFVMLPDGRYSYGLVDRPEVHVNFLADTLLIRHRRIKTSLNPYLEAEYLGERLESREKRNTTGKYRKIWDKYDGRCYYCGQHILKDQAYELAEICAANVRSEERYAYVHRGCEEGYAEVREFC